MPFLPVCSIDTDGTLAAGPVDSQTKAVALLHDQVRQPPAMTSPVTFQLQGGHGHSARSATLVASAQRVWLRPPRVRLGKSRREAVPVWIVRVWEINPPAGETPLEWVLLISIPIDDKSIIALLSAAAVLLMNWRQLAKLGGYANKGHNKPPGWLILWRGFAKPFELIE